MKADPQGFAAAFGYFSRWRDTGLFGRINHQLVLANRECIGREASPLAAVLDSQTVINNGEWRDALLRRR